MTKLTWGQALIFGLILCVGLYLRLTGIDWDDYHHYHPDERYIVWVGTTIEWPREAADLLDPRASTLNPFFWPAQETTTGIQVPQGEPRQFAYGHLPLYMGVGFTRLWEALAPVLDRLVPADWLFTTAILNTAEQVEFRHLLAVGRLLTGLVDVGTIVLLFLLGRRLFGTAVGLLAAALLAVTVMHIQLAHFFATDPYMTFFIVGALYCMVTAVMSDETQAARRTRYLLFAAVWVGLAIGSKFSAVVLGLPLFLTAFFSGRDHFYKRLLAAGVLVLVAFFVTNPFALLDNNCEAITPATSLLGIEIPAVNWRSCYLENIGRQSLMVQGSNSFPFTRQYDGTTPYLYFIEMQLRWGMGLALGTAAFMGFVWLILQTIRPLWQRWRTKRPLSKPQIAYLLLLSWCVPYFISTGNFYVKFMRYFQPITPFLVLFAAALIWSIPRKDVRYLTAAGVGVFTAVYALAFSQIYQQPHPWISASEWIYQEVEEGAQIAVELWDEPLPSSVYVDNVYQPRSQYDELVLRWLSKVGPNDDEVKLRDNLTLVAQADYIVVASNRVYGVAPRLPDVYPLSGQFHQLLFAGELGYELVYVADRTPRIGNLAIYPDTFDWVGVRPPAGVQSYLAERPRWQLGRADESFTVYDQPLTMIFKNQEKQTAEEMLRKFAKP